MGYDIDQTSFDPPNERRISGGAFLLSLLAFLFALPWALRGGPDWAFVPIVTFAVIAGVLTLAHGVEYAVRRRRAPRTRMGDVTRYAT